MGEIASAQELDALPMRSVVLDPHGMVWQRRTGGEWFAAGVHGGFERMAWPATLLYRPDAAADTVTGERDAASRATTATTTAPHTRRTTVADDALREAIYAEVLDYMPGADGPADARGITDAVLAVVAKHQDAEVERLRAEAWKAGYGACWALVEPIHDYLMQFEEPGDVDVERVREALAGVRKVAVAARPPCCPRTYEHTHEVLSTRAILADPAPTGGEQP